MTNSTDVFWEVDGVSLQTYAWNIATLGGSRDTVPPWRGADRQFAYKAGAAHRSRVAGSRIQTLAMWAIGMDEDGNVPADGEVAYNENRRMLKRLFWKPDGEQFVLTKRWRDSGGIHVAEALGIVDGTMEPEMRGPRGSAFMVDVFLADPWFYGTEVTTTIPVGVPTVVVNDGDDTCTTMEVEFVGALTNPLLTNSTPLPEVWLKMGYYVTPGDSVVVDVGQTTAIRGSNSANLIGAITHSGARAWMGLRRGNNTLTLTADAGGGHALVRHRPSYF